MQVLDEFSKHVDRIEWPVGSPTSIHYTALDDYLSRYQVGGQKSPGVGLQVVALGDLPAALVSASA